MALYFNEYLQRIKETSEGTSDKTKECERFLEVLCSDDAVNIMWQAFTLQCNEAMKGNESIVNTKKVHDLSIQYLSALVICRKLFTRFNSVTKIVYDLEDLKDFDISETTLKFIEENGLFKRLCKDERSNKIEKLLTSIQKPIEQKDQDGNKILEYIIQRHSEIIYTSMLLSNNDIEDALYMAVKSAFISPDDIFSSKALKSRILGKRYDFYNLKSFLCINLYNTLNEFHKYLAEISDKEEE